jgi:rhodanese-related sulfurtransferase
MNYKLPVMTKGKVVKSTILIALMLTALCMIPLALPKPETVQNITVDTAYNMIRRNYFFPDLVVLDVRNQSEYDINHLYEATLIPLHELETRIDELAEQMNDEIIVYCGSGERSETASGILAGNGFTKVYNMLGGITAWIEAEYPVYTTFHNVTVDTTGRRGINIEIEPLLLQMGCTSCNENQGCSDDDKVTDFETTVLEQEEDYMVALVTYNVNDTLFEITITSSLLWTYNENKIQANKTASFTLTEIATENITLQVYSLSYLVQHMEYNFTLSTILKPVNTEIYSSSSTIVSYAPAGKSDIESLEVIEFNSPFTVSQFYASLSEVVKEMGQVYMNDGIKNGDATFVQLAQNYYQMAKETSYLSRMVNRQLQDYDKEILQSFVYVTDLVPGSFEFWLCTIIVDLICSYFTGMACDYVAAVVTPAICALICGGPWNFFCYAPCLAGMGTFVFMVCQTVAGFGCSAGADYICLNI